MGLTLAASTQVVALGGGGLLLLATLLLAVTRRFGLALGLYIVYVGCLDGYVKLSTGSENIAVVRTILLGAIVAAGVLALITDRSPVTLPRGWVFVFAFVLVGLVEIANPGNPNLIKPIGSLRQEIESVPLFFLAYATIRRTADLQNLLLIIVAVAVANGIASIVQYNISPQQFASWGPGYRDRIFGSVGGVTGRIFQDGSATGRARPFGLGSDAGAGGVAGLIAAPALIALILKPQATAWGSASLIRGLAISAAPFVLLAVVLSLTRALVLATIVALVAQALLSARRQLIPLILVGAAAFLLGGTIIQQATGGTSGGNGLARYTTITPDSLLGTARESRGSAFTIFPQYVVKFPFGAGLGGVGPSTGFRGLVRPEESLNGETQFNVTLLDMGVPGLLLLFVVVGSALVRIRAVQAERDLTVRSHMAALAGPFVGNLFLFFTASPLSGGILAAYFWGVAGVLAYWMGTRRGDVAKAFRYNAAWSARARSQVSGATAERAATPTA